MWHQHAVVLPPSGHTEQPFIYSVVFHGAEGKRRWTLQAGGQRSSRNEMSQNISVVVRNGRSESTSTSRRLGRDDLWPLTNTCGLSVSLGWPQCFWSVGCECWVVSRWSTPWETHSFGSSQSFLCAKVNYLEHRGRVMRVFVHPVREAAAVGWHTHAHIRHAWSFAGDCVMEGSKQEVSSWTLNSPKMLKYSSKGHKRWPCR